MKNLKTILEVTNGKWGQKSSRAMKSEIEQIFRNYFAEMDIEIYECEKGFNVELFDAEGKAFALNINPTVKAYDFNIVDAHDIELDDRAQKEQNAREKKEKSEKKKEQDRIKREQAKAKRARA